MADLSTLSDDDLLKAYSAATTRESALSGMSDADLLKAYGAAGGAGLDDVAKASMLREQAGRGDADAAAAYISAGGSPKDVLTKDLGQNARIHGRVLWNDVKAIPGDIVNGVKGAVEAAPGLARDILLVPFGQGRIAERVQNASKKVITDPRGAAGDVVDAIQGARKSVDDPSRPVTSLLNAISLATAGDTTVGQTMLKAATKTAAGIDAGVRPVTSLLSGVSGDAQRIAQQAGERGGAAGRAFRANMAEPDFAAMQAEGQAGIRGLKAERGSAYSQGMQAVQNSTARLPYRPIQDALDDARTRFALGRNGSFVKDEAANATLDKMQQAINEHRAINGVPNGVRASRRSPLEMDELKQRLNSAWNAVPEGSRSEAALNPVRDAITKLITGAVPEYANVMAEYGGASDAINNAVKSLSLGKRATSGTAAGKLMSAMRDTGAATQITKGEALADVARHAPELPYMIAGATMNPVLPRGIVARGGALLHGVGGAGASAALAHFLSPGTLGPLLASSPRLIGNARYGVGAATRGARAAGLTQKNLGLAAELARLSSIYDDDNKK